MARRLLGAVVIVGIAVAGALALYLRDNEVPVAARQPVAPSQSGATSGFAVHSAEGNASATAARAKGTAGDLARVPFADLYGALERLIDDSSLSQRDKFNAVWGAYKVRRGDRDEARLLLDYLGPLVSTEESRMVLDEVLSPGTRDRDKSQMLTALMHLHDSLPVDSAGKSPSVISAAELQEAARRLMGSADPFLATSSLMVVSRLANDGRIAETAINRLQSRGLLKEDAYAREMLMQLRAFRDDGEQVAFSKRLVSWSQTSGEAKSALSKLAPGLIDESVVQSLSSEAKTVWRAFLEGTAPALRGPNGALDMTGAVVYTRWLQARAALEGVAPAEAPQYFLSQVSAARDPAAALAVLLSPYGQDVARAAAARGESGGLEMMLDAGRRSARQSDQASWNNGLAVVRSVSAK